MAGERRYAVKCPHTASTVHAQSRVLSYFTYTYFFKQLDSWHSIGEYVVLDMFRFSLRLVQRAHWRVGLIEALPSWSFFSMWHFCQIWQKIGKFFPHTLESKVLPETFGGPIWQFPESCGPAHPYVLLLSPSWSNLRKMRVSNQTTNWIIKLH